MTKVNYSHPLVEAAAGGNAAKVYFLRPEPERRMGFPDNPVSLDLNEERLLELARGEYTVVDVVPRRYSLTLSNYTEAQMNWNVKTLARTYDFEFLPGATYFVAIRAVDGEFRGVYFLAEIVDIAEAREMAAKLHAVGVDAQRRIEEISITKG